MDALVERVRGSTDSEGWALFSRLTEGYDPRTIVYTLVCLLHMVQEGSAVLRQDKLFGEIFVHLLVKGEKAAHGKEDSEEESSEDEADESGKEDEMVPSEG